MGELFRVSCLLGLVGFGGGISVLANMRDWLVLRRRWLTEREYVTTATVAQMLPGGAAANALAYTGLRFRGPLERSSVTPQTYHPHPPVTTDLTCGFTRLV